MELNFYFLPPPKARISYHKKVEESRRLARVRIHVERVIGQLRKKYTILHNTVPVSLIKCPSDCDKTNCTLDRILTVTAALTNYKSRTFECLVTAARRKNNNKDKRLGLYSKGTEWSGNRQTQERMINIFNYKVPRLNNTVHETLVVMYTQQQYLSFSKEQNTDIYIYRCVCVKHNNNMKQ